jgi:ABC-type transport system substrate-binding protein
VWSAPDPDRARALIGDAEAAGDKVTVWVTDEDPFVPNSVGVMRYIVEVLKDLRMHANLKIVHDLGAYFEAIFPPTASAGSSSHPQAYLGNWISPYLAAGDFIKPLFSCEDGPSGLCSKRLDARIDEAIRLYADDPGASSRAWTDIEHRLVDDAVMVPLTNPVFTNAVSARTENVQVHPQWGILLSRLWIQ